MVNDSDIKTYLDRSRRKVGAHLVIWWNGVGAAWRRPLANGLEPRVEWLQRACVQHNSDLTGIKYQRNRTRCSATAVTVH
jgi:hypothetical protein